MSISADILDNYSIVTSQGDLKFLSWLLHDFTPSFHLIDRPTDYTSKNSQETYRQLQYDATPRPAVEKRSIDTDDSAATANIVSIYLLLMDLEGQDDFMADQ